MLTGEGDSIIKYIWVWGAWVQLLVFRGAHDHVILVLHECIWNALLLLPAFDSSSTLDPPPHQVVYPPNFMVPPLVTASHFLVGNKEA